MAAERKLSKVAQAYVRMAEVRNAFQEMGARCMEVTEDKCGIVWSRYLVRDSSDGVAVVVVVVTPDWWDVFVPICTDNSTAATIAALKALQK